MLHVMQMLRTEPSIAESAAPLVAPLVAILNEGVAKVTSRSDAVSALCCLSILAAHSPAVNEQCRQQKARDRISFPSVSAFIDPYWPSVKNRAALLPHSSSEVQLLCFFTDFLVDINQHLQTSTRLRSFASYLGQQPLSLHDLASTKGTRRKGDMLLESELCDDVLVLGALFNIWRQSPPKRGSLDSLR